MSAGTAIQVDGINVYYNDFHALWDISLEVDRGEVVSIIGSNGSGKSTLLNTLAGQLNPKTGGISYFGESIGGLPPHETVARGMSLVPEGRRVFPRLTVFENLFMGSYIPRSRKNREKSLDNVYELFPRLKERHSQMANTLSGGEQQMLAIGRALMSEPKVLLCDEISLGLAPIIIKGIYQKIKQINELGLTIILVEQDITRSLKAADRAYVMLEGKVVLEGKPADLTEDKVKNAYFGI
ncbi:MAG: ABC transporter ATP-binding protein [Deltaproteobacteria bacterium]|nr:MAG: ABC transporter ATP-binding protein [Deltaproteobacteria bacterium]